MLYLSGAGFGEIGIIEFDRVEASNLHRQIIYNTNDINNPKTLELKQKLEGLNPTSRVKIYNEKWTSDTAYTLSAGYDVIVDCTDRYETRYLSDKVSADNQIPMVYGAVFQLEGQVAVFNYQGSKSYRDLFPRPDALPPHKTGGVIGPIAGMIGSMQAAEVFKITTGIGDPLVNKLASFSIKQNRYQLVEF